MDVKIIPISNAYRENYDRIFNPLWHHLKECSKRVASYPKWKQEIFGSYDFKSPHKR